MGQYAENGFPLNTVKGIVSEIEVSNRLEHEWTAQIRSVEVNGASWRKIPVAPSPYGSVGSDRDVLCDIDEASGKVCFIDCIDRCFARVLTAIRDPRVVHVERVNCAC